jgi:hypothetical protein
LTFRTGCAGARGAEAQLHAGPCPESERRPDFHSALDAAGQGGAQELALEHPQGPRRALHALRAGAAVPAHPARGALGGQAPALLGAAQGADRRAPPVLAGSAGDLGGAGAAGRVRRLLLTGRILFTILLIFLLCICCRFLGMFDFCR